MRVIEALLQLVLPTMCVGCQREGSPWCESCLGAAVGGAGRPAGGARASPPPVPVFSAGPYRGALRTAIVEFKDGGRRELAGGLALLLAAVIIAAVPAGAVLVPVPASRRALRTRGYDHMQLLTQRALAVVQREKHVGWASLLRLARQPSESVGLSAEQRRRNMRGVFIGMAGVRQTVFVVDDVMTSGATMCAAVQALRDVNISVGGGVVIGTG